MTELILGVVILSLLGYHAWYVHQTKKETAELLSRLASKNYQEYVEVKKIEERVPEVIQRTSSNVIPYEEYASVPENFDQMIKDTLQGGGN